MKKIFSVILCVILALSSCSPAAFAAASSEPFDSEVNEKTEEGQRQKSAAEIKIIACANKGDWQNAPENSINAVKNCGCNYVSVDVKVTADGVPVLMEDDTVERTCVDKDGKTVRGRVSELTYEKTETFFLRNSNGGLHNEKTDEKVPSLADTLNETFGKTLILDFALSDLDVIYDTVFAASAQSRVIFRIDGKAKDVVNALTAKETIPETIIKYDGNIIFSVNSTVKAAKNSGLTMVQLGSKNQYGVIFYETVENNIKSAALKGAFSMTDGWNAKREDNFIGWDDVIAHGYTFIETNYPDMLNTYIQQTEDARTALSALTEKCAEYDSRDYPQNIFESYKTAYDGAVSLLNGSASKSQLASAYTKLDEICNELDVAQGTSISEAALKITPGRVIAAVLCLAAVIAAQIFFIKRRKK